MVQVDVGELAIAIDQGDLLMMARGDRLVLLRDLARSGRLARLRVKLQDRPGALFKVMREFDDHHVNIIEIYHQRIFTNLPAKGLVTDIECEARDREQLDSLVNSLRSKGYAVSPVELN